MAYGFKLSGITQLSLLPLINMTMSDGETTQNYTLTRIDSRYYLDSHAGIFCNIYNSNVDAETILSESITLTEYDDNGFFDTIMSASYLDECLVTIDGHATTTSDDGQYYTFEYYDDETNKYYTFKITLNSTDWVFNVVDDQSATVAGTYTVVMKHTSKKDYSITVDDFYDGSKVGDEYTLTLSTDIPSNDFINAVKTALSIPSNAGVYKLLVNDDGSFDWSLDLG